MGEDGIQSKINIETKKSAESVRGLTDEIKKSKKATKENTEEVKKAKQELKEGRKGIATTKAELMAMISILEKIPRTLIKFADYTSDYTTSLKLLKTVLGESSTEAIKFVNKMSEMTGLDEATLNKQVALFSQLGQSLNLNSQNAEKFSEQLTILATKMSMLYNIDFSTMSTSLQRAIQGTQTTLKSKTGIEITDISAQALLNAKGIDRQVSSLNEAEQALVRYAVILERVGSDNNFYGDTVNSVAWQKQMLTAQVKRLATAIGNALYPVLQKVLPILNAILMVITEIINIIAKLVGYNVESTTATNSLGESFDNLGSSIGGAAKEARKSLRSFDKLNNITTPTSGGGGAGGGLGISPNMLSLLDNIDDKFLNIKNKATEIRDQIMDWLGFTKIIDSNTGEITWKLRDGYTNIKKIRDIVLLIISTIAALKIVSLIGNITKALAVLKSGEALGGIVGGLEAVGSGILAAFGVTSAGAIATIGTALAAVAGTILLIYTDVKLLQKAMQKAIGETDKLAGTSDKTVQRLQPVQDAFENLRSVINNVDYSGLAIKEEDRQTVLDSINKLTEEMKIALDKYVEEQIVSLNYLYYEKGAITEEEYEEELRKLNKYRTDELKKIDEKNAELLKLYDNLYDDEGKFSMKNYGKLLEYLNGYHTDVLKDLTINAEDKKIIAEAEAATDKEIKKKSYEELLTNFKNRSEAAKRAAKEEYDRTVENAKNIFGADSEKFRNIERLAKEEYDRQITEANRFYDEQYTNFANSNEDIAEYIDKDKAQIKTKWDRFWEKNGKIVEGFVKGITTQFRGIQTAWDGLKFAKKTMEVGAKVGQTIVGSNTESFASGGFPSGEDGLFYANHNELVGEFSNGKTAVANNGQIVEGIKQGVFSAMMSALSVQDFGAKVTIEASGDDAGLLNFINFKQKQLDRQFN